MTRRKSMLGAGSAFGQARRIMYKTQRAMGDAQAAERGPVPLGKRLVRRRATRGFFHWLGR